MNTITITNQPDLKREIEAGSIWQDPEHGTPYLLVEGADGYDAFSMKTGSSWNGIQKSVSEATRDLTLVCHSADITIQPKN